MKIKLKNLISVLMAFILILNTFSVISFAEAPINNPAEHRYTDGDSTGNDELIEISTNKLGNWASTDNRGNIRDILIENVNVLNTDRASNTVRIEGAGKKSTVENITLNNINVCGEKLTVLSKRGKTLKLVTNKYTDDISIDSFDSNFFGRVLYWFANLFESIKTFFYR